MNPMCHRQLWLILLFGWFSLLAGVASGEALPPSPSPHYVLDDARWLSPSAFEALDRKLETFEKETSSQLLVAIFPKIPDDAELVDFSQRLYGAWKPGLRGKDNGAIFLIFADNRKMRIHTGYGLEGALPDARCKQIIQEVVAPLLRSGDREAAIDRGVDAMIAAAKGEYQGSGKTVLEGEGDQSRGPGIIVYLIIGFFILGMIFPRLFTVADVVFGSFGSSRTGGGWIGGGGSGGSGGGGGFSGGGGSSGGGGASGDW